MKCQQCPTAGLPLACQGQQVSRMCDLVAMGRCDYAAMLYRQSTGQPAPFDCPGDTPDQPTIQPPPQAPPVVVQGGPPLVPLAVSLAVTQCEHRTKLPACGCVGKWRCERDAADVAWNDCVACKTAEA